MPKGALVEVNGVARQLKTGYVEVGGVARKLKAGYIEANGVAHTFWPPVTIPPFEPVEFDYTGAPREVVLPPGRYRIECWGARGGIPAGTTIMAKGGYTSGILTLSQPVTLYIYVGEAGNNTANSVGWNGGGMCGTVSWWGNRVSSGGGATDIRLVGGAWDNAVSLRSRIMVAGAGGGSYYNFDGTNTGGYGGVGGNLNGGVISTYGWSPTGVDNATLCTVNTDIGGKQNAGGVNRLGTTTYGNPGVFGRGGHFNQVNSPFIAAGGGGGWYGGGGGAHASATIGGVFALAVTGGGGSSFISGHAGCNAVNEDGTHRNNPTHYSNLVFTETIMIDGRNSMPNPRGAGNIVGNSGHGFVRITGV